MSYFTYLYRVFFDRTFHRNLIVNMRGTGVLYLLFLSTLILLPMYVVGYMSYKSWYAKDGMALVEKVPTLSLKEGRLSANVPQPYRIMDPDTKEVFATIDTTGRYKSIEQSGGLILLTKQAVYVKKNEVETRSYDLSQIQEAFTVTPVQIKEWMGWVNVGGALLFFPIMVLGVFISKLLYALLVGIISYLLTALLSITRPLEFGTRFRVSALAITPMALVNLALFFVGQPLVIGGYSIALNGWISLAVSLSFLTWIFWTIRESKGGASGRKALVTAPVGVVLKAGSTKTSAKAPAKKSAKKTLKKKAKR